MLERRRGNQEQMPQSAQFETVNIPSYSAFKKQTWPEFVLILLCTKQALCIEACQLPVSYVTQSHPFLPTCKLCEMKQIHSLIVSFDYVCLSESFCLMGLYMERQEDIWRKKTQILNMYLHWDDNVSARAENDDYKILHLSRRQEKGQTLEEI